MQFELERLEIDPIVDLPDPFKGHYRKSHLPESILELYRAKFEKPISYEQRLEEAIVMIEVGLRTELLKILDTNDHLFVGSFN